MTMDEAPSTPQPVSARATLAWLMWCYEQGYTDPADRAILTNWMGDDPAELHPDDVKARQALLAMADEILAAVAAETGAGAQPAPPDRLL